jgi:hypothetical protein
VEEKSVVSLKLTLPDASATSINAQGVVAWENGPGKRRKMTLPPGFGVEFTALTEADNKAIKYYVERARVKGYQSR